MAVDAILDLSGRVNFIISLKAIYVTVICFFVVLNFISFIMSYKIKNSNIAELLKGARIPKKNPKFSKFKAIMGILLIIGGYVIALKSRHYILFTMMPIFIIIVIGTRLLFTQFSVYFVDKLKNNKHIFYKGTNMITLSQIIYKLKDNAKIMFITSILSGVTLATAVAVYSFQQICLEGLQNNCPNDIGVIEQGINVHNVIAEGKIEEVLNKNNVKFTNQDEIKLIRVQNKDNSENNEERKSYTINVNTNEFMVMSLNDYNEIAEKIDKPKYKLSSGEAALYVYDPTFNIFNIKSNLNKKKVANLILNNNGTDSSFSVLYCEKGGVINPNLSLINTLIINNDDYEKMYLNSTEESKFVYYGYNLDNNTSIKALKTVKEIRELVPEEMLHGT